VLTAGMQLLLSRIQRVKRPPFHEMTAQAARQFYAAAAEILDMPRASLAHVHDFFIPAPDGHAIPARLYAAQLFPSVLCPVLVYFHGGGFVIGGLETHDSLCRQLALQSGGAVVAVDYRLAPEYPFPQAVNDAQTAWQWVYQWGHTLGLDAQRMAVGGDSAGGTLAAVSAIQARDQGVALALQLLITPGTAPDGHTASRRVYASGFMLDEKTLDWFFGQYMGDHARTDWRFAPSCADDLEGVAPAFVLLAECDPLVDEGVAYADQLRIAGGQVEIEITRGVVHDFIKMGGALPEARHAQSLCAQALKQAWGLN
jgi:acetyl esterase